MSEERERRQKTDMTWNGLPVKKSDHGYFVNLNDQLAIERRFTGDMPGVWIHRSGSSPMIMSPARAKRYFKEMLDAVTWAADLDNP